MTAPTDRRLFLLPGLDGTGLLFAPLLAALPSGCAAEVISYPTDKPLSFAEHVAHVKKRLPTSTPFTLLAESFSGPIAIDILAAGGFPVDKAIFVATFAASPRPGLLRLLNTLPLERLFGWNIPDRLIRHFCLGHEAAPDRVKEFRAAVRSVTPAVLARRLQILTNIDCRAKLHQIETPCLYLQAASDKLVPEQAAKDFATRLTGSTVRTIPGPHLLLQAKPHRCIEEIFSS
ncbi:MAG: alpha/beta hydrolase [Desulfuromonas sp.]|nr:MAG: alpha/beta hydrolase [Desulfuromonas sp.]